MTSYKDAYNPKKLPPPARSVEKKVETRFEPKEIPFDPNTYPKVGTFTPTKTNVGIYRTWKDMNVPVERKEVVPERKQGKLTSNTNKTLPLENGLQQTNTYTKINNDVNQLTCPLKNRINRNKIE
jgi:hypothetical protein